MSAFTGSPGKTAFGGINPLDLLLIPLAIGSFRLSAVASGPDQRLKALSH
jgi:hypothetical protein